MTLVDDLGTTQESHERRPMAKSFTHLHVHTEYSMLDGAARVEAVVAKAKDDGQPAVGITDHGNMYGVLDFYKAARKVGVKPIIGTEAYLAHEHRSERPVRRGGKVDDSGGEAEGGRKLYYHLTLLAENNVGYKNLIQIASRAYMEGYYYKPRVDWEVLAEHSEGLIATTGCLGGHVLQALLAGDENLALQRAGRLQDIFGKDNLFVEIQDQGIPEQHRRPTRMLFELARRIKALRCSPRTTATTCTSTTAIAHDRAALRADRLVDEPTPTASSSHGDRALPEDRRGDALDVFREVPEVACDNTLWIAERCKVEIEFGKPQLPRVPAAARVRACARRGLRRQVPPTSSTSRSKGARDRWGEHLPDAVVERLAYELQVIGDMGFSSYFLIVWRPHRRTRASANIRVGPGRGSAPPDAPWPTACASPTSIPSSTTVLFERFLNPSTRLDARHRHGLRLPLPRRDDPLRGRALRPRPRSRRS